MHVFFYKHATCKHPNMHICLHARMQVPKLHIHMILYVLDSWRREREANRSERPGGGGGDGSHRGVVLTSNILAYSDPYFRMG
jgi:hypothetical protein